VTPGVNEILTGAGVVDGRWFTDITAYRGSVVHALCQLDALRDLDESWIDEQENAADLHGYLAAHRRFELETGFKTEAVEERVYNPVFNYCGTLDKRGLLNGAPCLADYKTGTVTRITRYQLVAYLGCFGEPWLWTRLAVALRPDGTYSLKVYGPKDYRKDWAKWQSIVDVYRLRVDLGLIDSQPKRKGDIENGYSTEGTDLFNGPRDGDGAIAHGEFDGI
jgi:hypothetical protein